MMLLFISLCIMLIYESNSLTKQICSDTSQIYIFFKILSFFASFPLNVLQTSPWPCLNNRMARAGRPFIPELQTSLKAQMDLLYYLINGHTRAWNEMHFNKALKFIWVHVILTASPHLESQNRKEKPQFCFFPAVAGNFHMFAAVVKCWTDGRASQKSAENV